MTATLNYPSNSNNTLSIVKFSEIVSKYKIPDFQRIVSCDHVTKLKESQDEYFKLTGFYNFGVITICEFDGVEYIIDGQHRITALREYLKNNIDIEICVRVIPCKSWNEVAFHHKSINVFHANILTDNETCNTILDSVEKELFKKYENYLSDPKRKSPNYPKISTSLMKEKMIELDFLNVLKIKSNVELLSIIEDFNAFLNSFSKNDLIVKFKVKEERYNSFISINDKNVNKNKVLWLGIFREGKWIDCIHEVLKSGKTFKSFKEYSKFIKPETERKKMDREKVWKTKIDPKDPRCFNCHQTLNYSVKGTWEVAHLISVANGGSDEITNLEIMCFECNRKMGKNNYQFIQ